VNALTGQRVGEWHKPDEQIVIDCRPDLKEKP
jgi:hypothetical protein